MSHELMDPKQARYLDALDMVCNPRWYVDADGHFVGYDAIYDQLEAYRTTGAVTGEEYQYLRRRLDTEKSNESGDYRRNILDNWYVGGGSQLSDDNFSRNN